MRSHWMQVVAALILSSAATAVAQSPVIGTATQQTGPGTPACLAATNIWTNTMMVATQATSPELRLAYTSQVQALTNQKAAACGSSPIRPGSPASTAQTLPPLTVQSADSLLSVARTSQDTLAVAMRVAAGDTVATRAGASSPVVSGKSGMGGITTTNGSPAVAPAVITVQNMGSSASAARTSRCGHSTVAYLKALNYSWNTATLVRTKVHLYEEIMFAKTNYRESCGGVLVYPRALRSGEGPGDTLTDTDFR